MTSEVVKALKKLELKFNKSHADSYCEIRGGGHYFYCSCGASGPSRKSENEAKGDWTLHVQKFNRELELVRKAQAAVNGVEVAPNSSAQSLTAGLFNCDLSIWQNALDPYRADRKRLRLRDGHVFCFSPKMGNEGCVARFRDNEHAMDVLVKAGFQLDTSVKIPDTYEYR